MGRDLYSSVAAPLSAIKLARDEIVGTRALVGGGKDWPSEWGPVKRIEVTEKWTLPTLANSVNHCLYAI